MTPRTVRALLTTTVLIATAACGGADDVNAPPANTPRQSDTTVYAGMLVSEPVVVAGAARGAPNVASLNTTVAYVSLLPGTVPDGRSATITDLAYGGGTVVEIENGGFDPQPIPATAGDTIEIAVHRAAGGTVRAYVVVAVRSPPRIVRTNPPKGQTDVPVNASITIVFSEPMAASTVTDSSIVVTAAGVPVAGTVALLGSFSAEFLPDAPLAPSTEYTVSVRETVADLSGDALAVAAAMSFTTAAVIQTTPLRLSTISVSSTHACGIAQGANAFCWGRNTWGSIGDGTTTDRSVAVPVGGSLAFVAVSAGNAHTCALTNAGAAYCWGSNSAGQLGNGTFTGTAVPVPVASSLVFATISAGQGVTCAVTAAGDAYCWGVHNSGMLGAGSTTACPDQGCPLPAAVTGGVKFVSVVVGGDTVCGRTASGAAYCWGYNSLGELGNGNASGPEQCSGRDYAIAPAPYACSRSPLLVTGGLTFATVYAGGYFSCGLLADGSLHCWGANNTGEFGLGTTSGTAHPTPNASAGAVRFRLVAPGNQTICGVALSGQAYCWGLNQFGLLAPCVQTNCDRNTVLSPVRSALVFSAMGVATSRACGLTADGSAYCWGRNIYGTLGNNSLADSPVPVAVLRQQ